MTQIAKTPFLFQFTSTRWALTRDLKSIFGIFLPRVSFRFCSTSTKNEGVSSSTSEAKSDTNVNPDMERVKVLQEENAGHAFPPGSAPKQDSPFRVAKLLFALKPMSKANPSEAEKNNARRMIGIFCKMLVSEIKARKSLPSLPPKDVITVLNAMAHLDSTHHTPTHSRVKSIFSSSAQGHESNESGRTSQDLTPVYSFLEESIWRSDASKWNTKETSSLVKLCEKIRTIPILSILASVFRPCIHTVKDMDSASLVSVTGTYLFFDMQHAELSKKVLLRTKIILPTLGLDSLSRLLVFLKAGNSSDDDLKPLIDKLLEDAHSKIESLSTSGIARYCEALASTCFSVKSKEERTEKETRALQEALRRSIDLVPAAALSDITGVVQNLASFIDREDFHKLMKVVIDRVLELKKNLKSAQIACLFRACQKQIFLSEVLFNALAEHACTMIDHFEISELAVCLEVLSSFDLFDAEFFNMTAARIAQLTRQKIIIDPDYLTQILLSFSKLKEKNEAILFSSAQQLLFSLSMLTSKTINDIIQVYEGFSFNYRNIQGQLRTRATDLSL